MERDYLCVSKVQKEWDYCHANWLLIRATSRGKAKAEYCRLDGDTDFCDVECRINKDSTMGAKLDGQGHPMATTNDN